MKEQTIKGTKSVVVFIRGIPGSGKSYLAAELQKIIDHDKLVVLDPDATDYTSHEYTEHTRSLAQEGVDPKLHAYRFLRAKAYKAIEDGKIIIWNQPFTSLEIFDKVTKRLTDHAISHNCDIAILVVEVEVDPKVASQRVTHRKHTGGHGPSDTIFDRFVSDFASFEGHGYDVLKVDGEGSVRHSAQAIEKALDSLVAG